MSASATLARFTFSVRKRAHDWAACVSNDEGKRWFKGGFATREEAEDFNRTQSAVLIGSIRDAGLTAVVNRDGGDA